MNENETFLGIIIVVLVFLLLLGGISSCHNLVQEQQFIKGGYERVLTPRGTAEWVGPGKVAK